MVALTLVSLCIVIKTDTFIDKVDSYATDVMLDGDYVYAERLFRFVLTHHASSPTSFSYADAANMVGATLAFQRKLADAEAFYRVAVPIHCGPGWPSGNSPTPPSVRNLVRVLIRSGKFCEAEDLLVQDLKNTCLHDPKDRLACANVLQLFMQLYEKSGLVDDAIACGQHILGLGWPRGVHQFLISSVHADLASLYIYQQRKPESFAAIMAASNHEIIAKSLTFIRSEYYLAFGDIKQSMGVIEEQEKNLKSRDIQISPEFRREADLRIGIALLKLGQQEKANGLLLRTLQSYDDDPEIDLPAMIRLLNHLTSQFPGDKLFLIRLAIASQRCIRYAPRGVKKAIGVLPAGY